MCSSPLWWLYLFSVSTAPRLPKGRLRQIQTQVKVGSLDFRYLTLYLFWNILADLEMCTASFWFAAKSLFVCV